MFRRRSKQPVLLTLLLACLVAAVSAAPAGAIQPLGEYGLGEGGQAGLLDTPTGVAVDSAGRVYVSERANNRISVFAGDGRFLRAFGNDVVPGGRGGGVEQCTTVCKPGVPGAGPGELTSPGQIAVDADGSVYVLEGGPLTPRVSAFDARGRFLRVFGRDVDAANPGTGFEVCTSKCKAATRGSRAGELDRPFGITIDPAGILWVSDGGNHRVAAYTVDGTFLRAFGKDVNLSLGGRRNVCSTRCKPGVSDGSAGAINGPLGVGVNAAGTMYVNDGERVTVLSPEGDFLRAFGKDVIPGNAETGFEVCTTLCRGGTEGTGPREFFGPRSTVFDAAGRIYISDSDNNRVQVLNRREGFRQAFGKDVVPGDAQTGFEVCTTQCQAGATGAGPGQTSFPQQMAIDCRGGLYVAEQSNDRVERFGEPGTDGEPCVAASVLTSGFGVMQVERHVRTGTATLIVTVPRAATVRVDGARILPARRRAAGARRLRLAIRPTARTARRLERTGRALVRANVSYAATNGAHHRKTRLILLTKSGRR